MFKYSSFGWLRYLSNVFCFGVVEVLVDVDRKVEGSTPGTYRKVH